MVWAGASFVTKINQRQCAICARHVGGTIRSCQRAILNYDRFIISSLGKEMPVFEAEDDEDGNEDSDSSGGEEEAPKPMNTTIGDDGFISV